MHEHELVWRRTPKGAVKYTPWGWQASCKCGWEQKLPAGGKGFAVKQYHSHKEEK